jgi:hypothetical protein
MRYPTTKPTPKPAAPAIYILSILTLWLSQPKSPSQPKDPSQSLISTQRLYKNSTVTFVLAGLRA